MVKKLVLILILLHCSSITSAKLNKLKFVNQYDEPIASVVVTSPQFKENQLGKDPLIMDQQERQFSPRILVVQVGQEVSFPNSDNIRHHVYSFSDPKPFEIKLYSGQQAEPIQFDIPGIVVLGCNIHDSMLGFIYVNNMPNAHITDSRGLVEIDSAITQITYWHPDLSIDNQERVNVALEDTESNSQIIKVSTVSNIFKPTSSKRTFGSTKMRNE